MSNREPDLNVRPSGHDGWRTPPIEDDQHPLNVWRSQQSSSGTAFESSSRSHSQEEMAITQPTRPQHAETTMSSSSLRVRPTHRSYLSSHSAHPEHLPWKERIKHTSWAWFTMSMATGGLANAMNAGMSKISTSSPLSRRHMPLVTVIR